MTLVRIVNPAVIPSAYEYWSMQIAAVILCLHDQRTLSTTPQKLLGSTWEGWSLSEFRGRASSSAFSDMRGHIQNWGTQYLLADALNSDSLGLLQALLRELEAAIGNISLEGANTECYVSGNDSRVGSRFLEECRARILGNRRRRVSPSRKLVQFSDLCILVRQKELDLLAIFGEVEGNHGERLLQQDYWLAKSPYATFGIGLLPGQDVPVTTQVIRINGSPRVLLLMGTNKNLIVDFHLAVDVMQKLMLHGPSDKWWLALREGLADVVRLVIDWWGKPVVDLLATLRHSASTGEQTLVIRECEVSTLQQNGVPSILNSPALMVVQ